VDDHDDAGALVSGFCVRPIITGRVGMCLRALSRASYRFLRTRKPESLLRRPQAMGQRQNRHLEGDRSMNKDTIEGNWKQLKGKAKEQWGKLTDDDFDVIAGKRDQLLGRIQERHGISRDEAERQVKDWETRDGRTPDALWFEKY
jgi:uncharacterized protein YjbJ (UPF0337 family)